MHAERLLRKVRLGAIAGSQLKTYISEEINAEPGCKELLKGFLDGPSDSSGPSTSSEMFAARGVQVRVKSRKSC